jgi:hypothetical protein
MTKLGAQRTLPTQLILHPSTVTTPLIQHFKILIVFVHFIRDSEFPIIVVAFDILVFVTLGSGFVSGVRGGIV